MATRVFRVSVEGKFKVILGFGLFGFQFRFWALVQVWNNLGLGVGLVV